MTAGRVLVLEDDEDIASALARGLAGAGYQPVVAHDTVEAEAVPELSRLDAAVIDVMLGAEDGRDVVRRLRLAGMDAPIVMLSALSAVDDRAAGLEAGADDYVAKPFDLADLIARLQVQARRRDAAAAARLGTLGYDRPTRTLTGSDGTAPLTEREGVLLELFLASHGTVLGRHEIYVRLWGDLGAASENVVDVYVGYLRRKLAAVGDTGVVLRTVRGRGFVLDRRHDA